MFLDFIQSEKHTQKIQTELINNYWQFFRALLKETLFIFFPNKSTQKYLNCLNIVSSFHAKEQNMTDILTVFEDTG